MRLLLPLLLVACGSRSTLDAPLSFDAANEDVLDASVTDAKNDGDATIDVQEEDVVIVTDAGCKMDSECNDMIACTEDHCDPQLHVCTHAPKNALCDDGLFCTGDEVCNAQMGCVTVPRNCADAIACSDDTCDEPSKSCVHKPNDSKCPISHACDLQLGCQARAFAHDQSALYDVRLPSGQVKLIGQTGVNLTDCALHPNNTLYGVAFGSLYTIDQMTGKATFFKSINAMSLNGADADPNGTLYVSGGTSLYILNQNNGNITFVQSFPQGRSSSGDLAFIGSRLLGSANGNGGDDLVEFDLANKTSKVLGPIGFQCVWGLAAYGMTLYGLTCQGHVLSINTTTGKGTSLNQVNTQFWGASAR